MDLSKLYYEKEQREFDAQEAIDIQNIVEGWMNDAAKATGHDSSKTFSNIKMKSVPAYYFKFNLQILEREFYENKRPATTNDVSSNPKKKYRLEDFSPDEFPIEDIPLDERKDSDHSIIKTHNIYDCPKCGGAGRFKCPECKGAKRGTKYCPKCRLHRGFEECPSCYGKGGRYLSDGSWKECRTCHGKKEITCQMCHGDGIIELDCPTCEGKGYLVCETCEGNGRMIKYIAMKDSYFPETSPENSELLYHDSIPEELKSILYGDSDNPENIDKRLLALAQEDPVIDAEEKMNKLISSLTTERLTNVKERLDKIRDSNEYSLVREGENTCQKITKINTKIYKIEIIRITYDYSGKNYDLWLYGKDKNIFNEDNPFLQDAEKYAKEADELKKNKPVEAICKYEKACEIALSTKNFQALKLYSEELKSARKKSNIDFWLGLFAGLGLTIFFYLFALKKLAFEYPSSAIFLSNALHIKSEKTVNILSKVLNVILNYITPSLLFSSIMIKIVRDKMKNRVIRILSGIISLLLYALLITLLYTKCSAFRTPGFIILNTIVLIAAVIIGLGLKVPYENLLLKNDNIFIEESSSDESEDEEDSDSEGNDSDEEESSNSISEKRRLLAMLLSLFLGYLGVHSFYVGKKLRGFFQLALFLAGCFLLGVTGSQGSTKLDIGGILIEIGIAWGVLDFIIILIGKFKDKDKATLKKWW